MNRRNIHTAWYFKVLLLALLLNLGAKLQAHGYSYAVYTIDFLSINVVYDGDKDVKPATIRMREHKLDFTLPDIPQFTYNPETGEIETTA